jgi:hypothetical protein
MHALWPAAKPRLALCPTCVHRSIDRGSSQARPSKSQAYLSYLVRTTTGIQGVCHRATAEDRACIDHTARQVDLRASSAALYWSIDRYTTWGCVVLHVCCTSAPLLDHAKAYQLYYTTRCWLYYGHGLCHACPYATKYKCTTTFIQNLNLILPLIHILCH